ncbi:MAG TPA: DHA2 family efflux MFS transporter permease subunit [Acetobacteraceae bacterium]|nr:DHA2 family efflux MFS transporter permease subunit [Acetobacteraceae bacterium]
MPASLPRSAAGNRNPWLIAVIVSIATFMEVLDTTIVNVALTHIAGSLAISLDESTWILTSYLVANAIVLPISGWLANVLGRKRFYMICVAVFTASSVLCAASTSLTMIMLARTLQGAGGGGLAPTEQSIFADTFPPEKRALAFALYGLTVVTAPAAGPVLGGYLTDAYSWHWCFLINLPIGLLSLTLVQLFVSEPSVLRQERRDLLAGGLRVDYIGFALVVLGFGSLQIMLDRYERDNGFSSSFITSLALVAAVSLLCLVVWELLHPQPVMNLRLFRSRGFAISCVMMFMVFFTLISTTQLLPQLSQELLGYNSLEAGYALAYGGIATLIIMPIAGFVTGRLIQPKWLILGALIGTGWGLLSNSGLDLDISFWTLAMARVRQVIWLPLLFIPLSAVSYVGVPPERNNEASALQNLMRNLGGSIGVSVVTTLLQQRTQFHHERLASHITAYNGYGWNVPLAHIARAVQTQASMMSYLDMFWLLGIVALCIWPLALFLPRMPKGAAPGH